MHAAQLRVAFVTDIITPYSVAVLEQLARKVDLVVLFCAASGTRGLQWRFGALPFEHAIVGGLTIRRPHPDATDFYLSPRVLSALRAHRPDVTISAGYSFPTAYAAAYSRLSGTPLVVHCDGTSDSEADLTPPQVLARRVVLRRASVVVANSEPAAARFEELGVRPSRIVRALHSTDIAPLLAVAERRRYGSPGALRVLASGRLIARKGLDRLIEAINIARQTRPGIRLTIVGSGPEEGRLRALAGDAVGFAGFVEPAELPRYYERAEAYAFPTLRDPFGIVLLEAAAAALPLVSSSRAGATHDLITDGISGLVVDPDDLSGMARAFERLADDPALRERLGTAARRRVEGRTPEATARGYVAAAELAVAVGA
jgi:glycosyltransferase involved in cell wall biosynthesis